MKTENRKCAVKKCNCRHEFQDKVYGHGNRLMTATKNTAKPYRCTVCNKENP